eukprot:7490382-Pyramimonas_sp.AAC.1
MRHVRGPAHAPTQHGMRSVPGGGVVHQGVARGSRYLYGEDIFHFILAPAARQEGFPFPDGEEDRYDGDSSRWALR